MGGSKPWLTIVTLVISTMVSIAAGVLTVIISITQGRSGHAVSVILIIGEFISIFGLPLWLATSRTPMVFSCLITLCSNVLSLVAGLLVLNSSIWYSKSQIRSSILGRAFVCLFVIGLFIGGIAIGCMLQSFNYVTLRHEKHEDNAIDQVLNEKFTRSLSLSNKVVSTKPSAATLVDKPETISTLENSRMRSSSTLNSFVFKRQVNNHTDVSYSIKKLSVINQSNSSANVSEMGKPRAASKDTIKSSAFTPMLSRTKDSGATKSLMLERDAIKRIPSVLLPPHLRPQEPSHPMVIPPQSLKDIADRYCDEALMQKIPRAATMSVMPLFKDRQGMKTLTLEDYEKNYEEIQQHAMTSASFHHFPHIESYESSDRSSLNVPDVATVSEEAEDSTEEALKYLEGAQDANEEDLKSAMDQTAGDLNLERMRTPSTLILSKSNSPQKSIFAHSRKNSSISFKGVINSSASSSPKRRTSFRGSPRKLGLKNLSLSSIVYKEPDDTTPNFSYVHELQSSPKKKSQVTPRKDPLCDKTNTPESTHSGKSVFPTEVIGEYDKEKWKTMVRLQLVGAGSPERN